MSDEPTIRDIFYKLGAMESKLDSALANQTRDRKRIDQLEDRTSRLEKLEARRTGVLTVIVGIFSLFSAAVVNFITSHLNIN